MSNLNVVEYDANQHNVDAVTVFQSNRAEVRRKIAVQLKDGQNEVEVKNLPTCLDQNSIRVHGIGKAVILNVIYHPPPPVDQKTNAEHLGDLPDRRTALTAKLAILKRQAAILKGYSKSLTGSNITADQLEIFLESYALKQQKINDTSTELRKDLKQIDSQIQDADISLHADEESVQLRGVKVTIIVLGDGDGEAEFTLTYVVSNAWWTPQYDLRASIAHDSKSTSSVSLHYRASIAQRTGENWTTVALTLSTASPLQGTDIPELMPQWIGKTRPRSWSPQPVLFQSRRRSRSRSHSPPIMICASRRSRSRRRSSSTSSTALDAAPVRYIPAHVDAGFDAAAEPPLGFFSSQDAVATAGAVSATFTIPGLSSIPTGSSVSSQTHKVSIAEIAFSSVELEWLTVPKRIPSVFLQCKVKNTSNYVLLPGEANVFMNNNYVAKSMVPRVSPQEAFSCSLGVDPAVRVTYHPQSKKSKTTGVYVVGTKTNTTAFEQSITIKNTRVTPLGRLIVKDQVPVSRDASVKVNVLEPRELQGASESGARRGPVIIRKGIQARWARHNEEGASSQPGDEDGRGLLEWVCDIGPGVSVDFNLAWEVIVPVGVEWTQQF